MYLNKQERSRKSVKIKKLEELVLPNSKLRFCVDQLQNLNFIFNKRLKKKSESTLENSVLLAKSVTERLVQRLLCGVALIDPRFSTKFLICARHDQNKNASTNLEYIVRLDALSTPTLYSIDETPRFEILETDPHCPAGYARIRLQSSALKNWTEYVNSSGFLRRDRIQARLVELLAQSAAQDKPNSPLQVDESISCGIPGKIVDAASLHDILKISSEQQVFYGPGGNVPRFPDTRDFRLAIVDEPNGIKIRVEFLSPALSSILIKVRILVAVGVDFWPATSDFPSRVPLGHPDCFLCHQAAQTGMYLVGYGVHSTAWQIRLSAAEFMFLNHYGIHSTVRTILDILYEILNDINSIRRIQKPISYKILNRYMLFTVILEELEENSKSSFGDMLNWSPVYLSTLILKLLDNIIPKLHSEFQPNYFFKKANLLVNPGHLCDDDFIIEANNVRNYMVKLFDESVMSNKGNEEFENLMLSQESEMHLLYKWKELVDGLLPPSGTRGRRFCFAGSKNKRDVAHSQYTTRQLEYIGLLLHGMLKVKQHILQEMNHTDNLKSAEDDGEHPMEDIIFIIVNIMDQARDQYLLKQSNDNISKNRSKIKITYNAYVAKLIELIRKDKELLKLDLEDDMTLVKTILKHLYKAMDQNKKYLAPILRPYLSHIFATSHFISCDLDLIKNRLKTDEIEALASFSSLVNSGTITPAQGLIDSVNKQWMWAKNMLELVEKNTLRLVFIMSRGKIYRHILSLPSYTGGSEGERESSKTWNSGRKRASVRRRKTLPGRNYFSSIINEGIKDGQTEFPQHEILKGASPLTVILSNKHRRGQHRGSGDILKSMTSMKKLSVFQEAASSLPKEEQNEIFDVIQNIHSAKTRSGLNKKWSATLPNLSNLKIRPQRSPIQKYTPKEESAGVQIKPSNTIKTKTFLSTDTLLGTSRATRLREDNTVFYLQESFRIRSLVQKSESFKY